LTIEDYCDSTLNLASKSTIICLRLSIYICY